MKRDLVVLASSSHLQTLTFPWMRSRPAYSGGMETHLLTGPANPSWRGENAPLLQLVLCGVGVWGHVTLTVMPYVLAPSGVLFENEQEWGALM